MRALKREREIRVGHDEPRTPTRSLPSYQEPTPETHRKLTREDEAEIALKRTVFTRGTRLALIALFLITIAIVPIVQFIAEMRGSHEGKWLPTFETFRVLVPTKHGF